MARKLYVMGENTSKITFPFVIVALCTLIALAYIVDLIDPTFSEMLVNSPAHIAAGHYWVLFTSSFAHAGLWHVMLNIPIILYVGIRIEKRFGHLCALCLCVISSFAADAFAISIYIPRGYSVTFLGASGIKCGLLGFGVAVFIYEFLSKGVYDPKRVLSDHVIVLVLALFEIVLSFMPGIAWSCHVGGALAGIILSVIWIVIEKRKTAKVPSP